MNTDHFAVVIGLSSYPDLGDPPPSNLRGPENDAAAIAGWLADPNGGGLPPENIQKITSTDAMSPPSAAPTPSDLNKAFKWLDKLAAKNSPRRVGKRLYLYVSGHGFSSRPGIGCLLTGDAADQEYSANISPSAWLDWLRDASYFNEYVLWMDCCMDRVVLAQPTQPPLLPSLGRNGVGKAFIVFAAPRPLKAAEKAVEEDKGNVHGVFTWNLIQGLRGAGADQNGLVHSGSLVNWLREAQLAWLDDDDRANPSVAKEPAIVAQDPGIVFARNATPFAFDVTLRIPSASADTEVWLWSGHPPQRDKTATVISPGGTKLSLKPGLYLAEGNGLRHGFAVTRSPMTVSLVDKGDPVVPSAGGFTVRVAPDDPSADIRLCDNLFDVVMGGTAELESPPLSFGLYQIRRTTGRQITEKVILLDGNWPPPGPPAAAVAAALPPAPPITSAAPLPGTRATHEYQEAAASVASFDISIGDGAELMVMARWYSTGTQTSAPKQAPWQGVSVVDASGTVVADLETQGRHGPGSDPVAACSIRLRPGTYELRYPIGTVGVFAQSLILPPGGWRMEAYLLHSESEISGRPAVSLLMRKAGEAWGGDQDVQFQTAMVALADERPIVNEQLLSGTPANPLARIVGAHLLLLSARNKTDAEAAVVFDRLNGIVTELRALVGTAHPDVEALSLKCSDPTIRTTTAQLISPMFERSWQLLVEGSQTRPELIPAALWTKVHATAELPPYLIWAEDDSVQTAFRKALTETIFAQRAAPAAGIKSSTELAMEAVTDSLKSIKSYSIDGFEKVGSDIGAVFRGATRQSSPQASPSAVPPRSIPGVSVQEIARRAQRLHLPPAAIEVLRQDLAARAVHVTGIAAALTRSEGG